MCFSFSVFSYLFLLILFNTIKHVRFFSTNISYFQTTIITVTLLVCNHYNLTCILVSSKSSTIVKLTIIACLLPRNASAARRSAPRRPRSWARRARPSLLYFIMLYYNNTILYYTILYYTILYYNIISYYIILYGRLPAADVVPEDLTQRVAERLSLSTSLSLSIYIYTHVYHVVFLISYYIVSFMLYFFSLRSSYLFLAHRGAPPASRPRWPPTRRPGRRPPFLLKVQGLQDQKHQCQHRVRTGSGQGQDSVGTGSAQGQHRVRTGSGKTIFVLFLFSQCSFLFIYIVNISVIYHLYVSSS